MRYAFFGDIHGNLEALTEVLAAVDAVGVDELFCMGDIVGYGANPEECLQIIRDRGVRTVAGNHDHAAIGRLDISYFNQFARKAAIWTQQRLSDEAKAWIYELPLLIETERFTLVHGSLHAPELFNYVQTMRDAEYNFDACKTPLLFLGHSHQPLAFFNTQPMTYTLDEEIPVDTPVKMIVNVGSVGQPRDEDPRSCFAVYDSEEALVTLHRVAYDIETVVEKILRADLPEPLALRLRLGK